MWFRLSFLISLLVILATNVSKSQDTHFSQVYATPISISPALTGVFDGTYRIGLLHRSQYRSTLEDPFQTYNFAADFKFDLDYNRSAKPDFVGVGLSFYSDRVGTFDFNTTTVLVSAAYHKSLNERKTSYLGLGFQVGIAQRTLNYEDLTFPDQFNTLDGYTLETGEALPANNFAYGDFSLGLNYTTELSKNNYLYLSGGYYHINQPNLSFYASSDDPDPNLQKTNTLFSKFVINTAASIKMNERYSISPRIIGFIQDIHKEFSFGTGFKYDFFDTKSSSFLFGFWLRTVDGIDGFSPEAFVGMVGIQRSKFIVAFSYDKGLSPIANSRLSLNSFELSFRYIGTHENENYLCPSF